MWPLYVVFAAAIVPLAAACLVRNRIVKGLLSAVSILPALLSAVLLVGFVLPVYMGVHGVWMGFALCGAVYAVGMMYAWKPFTPKARRVVALSLAGALALSAAATAGPYMYGKSVTFDSREEIRLLDYMPFPGGEVADGDTLIKQLDVESALKLSGVLPRLDGATALYPLYSAFVRAAYPPDDYSPYVDPRTEPPDQPAVVCSTTDYAFENLIGGYADMVFLMGVSDGQRARAKARGLELELTPIGREAFVFFVNSRNAAENLSAEDIKGIYSGRVTNWRELGGGGAIMAYQRPEESGSQIMLREIMGDTPVMPAPQEDVYETMMGMLKRVANYRNYKNSLGYSFMFYIQGMVGEREVKLLSVNGTPPTRENIASGAYPFSHDFYAVTAKRDGEYLNPGRAGNTDAFLAWILSPQGQYLVDATGYVPVK